MTDLILYGSLCALMVEFARCAPVEERRQATQAAGVLCAVWVLFCLSWYRPLAPAHLLTVLGIKTAHEDMWMLADALAGAAMMAVACERLWSWALWALLFAQVLTVAWCHSLDQQYADYSIALNLLFLGQVAVFGAIGGRGFVDRVRRGARRLRLSLRAQTARSLAGQRGGS